MNHEQLIAYYRNEFDTLMSVGSRYGCEPEETKDIIQQLFLQFAEKHTDLDALTNPKAYIITSFKRKLIDQHRRITRMARYNIPVIRVISDESIDVLLIEKEESEERIKILTKGYHNLPSRCQKVIYLKYMQGLTNEQIAEKTGLTLRSIYNNLSEGIKQLRSEVVGASGVLDGKRVALGLILASLIGL